MGRHAIREVRFCLDADEAGREAAARLGMLLGRRDIRCSFIALPDGKDPNQVLVEDGLPALRDLLKRRVVQEEPEDFRPSDVAPALEPERQATGDGFMVRFGETPSTGWLPPRRSMAGCGWC